MNNSSKRVLLTVIPSLFLIQPWQFSASEQEQYPCYKNEVTFTYEHSQEVPTQQLIKLLLSEPLSQGALVQITPRFCSTLGCWQQGSCELHGKTSYTCLIQSPKRTNLRAAAAHQQKLASDPVKTKQHSTENSAAVMAAADAQFKIAQIKKKQQNSAQKVMKL